MLPLTAFYKCEGKAAGVQYRCIACCARPPKSYECGLCQGGFRRTDRGGTTEVRARKVHLCDTCEVTHKWCARCDVVKPREEFGIARTKPGGRMAHCKSCQRGKYAARTDQEKLALVVRKHGMTEVEWRRMYETQGGRCAICGELPGASSRGRKLHVDHCHQSNAVRALLCGPCNVTLGHMKDDPTRLRAAADYLERFAS